MKVGDKYIVEIDKIFEQDGEKLYRAKGMKTLVFDNKGLRKLKPLEEKNMEIIRDKAFEAGQVKGQNDAWELASKIVSDIYHGGYNSDEVTEIFGYFSYQNIWEDNTYAEAAAKVAEWERKKGEIKADDISREVIDKMIMEHCTKCNELVENEPCKECYIGVAIKIIGKAKAGEQE